MNNEKPAGQPFNYIVLINHTWQLIEQGILDSGCAMLYLYLIHKSNSLGWKNPFNQSNRIIQALLNISEPTLISRRKILVDLGLIKFESGKAIRQNSIYYLNNFSSVFSSSFSGVDENTLDYNKPKPNQPKPNQNNTPPTGEVSEDFLFYKNLDKKVELIEDFIKAKAPQFIEPYLDYYNLFADKYGKIKQDATSSLKKHLKNRLLETEFDFIKILFAVGECEFLKTANWFDLEWILKSDENYKKILNGKFKKSESAAGKPGDNTASGMSSKDRETTNDLNLIAKRGELSRKIKNLKNTYSEPTQREQQEIEKLEDELRRLPLSKMEMNNLRYRLEEVQLKIANLNYKVEEKGQQLDQAETEFLERMKTEEKQLINTLEIEEEKIRLTPNYIGVLI